MAIEHLRTYQAKYSEFLTEDEVELNEILRQHSQDRKWVDNLMIHANAITCIETSKWCKMVMDVQYLSERMKFMNTQV